MKSITIILFFLLTFFVNFSNAQNCDIAQAGVAVYDAANTAPVLSVSRGQDANFKFSISNAGTGTGCSIPANSVTAIFDFPTLAGGIKPYIYSGPASFVSGYFKWTYNSSEEVLLGTNTTAIPSGQGDLNILVKIRGNAGGSGHSNLNLTQGGGASDNTANNFAGAQLKVTENSSLPVLLSAFTVTPDKCNALLNWTTASSESKLSHFEIEYSPDGRTFIKIDNVAGKNSNAGADYKFSYRQLNGDGYYRLKLVDKDGSFGYSNTVHAITNCSDKSKVLVYPNPISYDQKLIVAISGYSGKIKGELYNATGQKVTVYSLINSANELSVMNISAGVYMLKIRSEDGESASFKIVVTR
jgi:hypothetical protein